MVQTLFGRRVAASVACLAMCIGAAIQGAEQGFVARTATETSAGNLDHLFGPYERHHRFTLEVDAAPETTLTHAWLRNEPRGAAALLAPPSIPSLPRVNPQLSSPNAAKPATNKVDAHYAGSRMGLITVLVFLSALILVRRCRAALRSLRRDFAVVARSMNGLLGRGFVLAWLPTSRRLQRPWTDARHLFHSAVGRWVRASWSERRQMALRAALETVAGLHFLATQPLRLSAAVARHPSRAVRLATTYAVMAMIVWNPLGTASTQAVDYYWDQNQGSAGTGGTGAWDTTSTFWRLGSALYGQTHTRNVRP